MSTSVPCNFRIKDFFVERILQMLFEVDELCDSPLYLSVQPLDCQRVKYPVQHKNGQMHELQFTSDRVPFQRDVLNTRNVRGTLVQNLALCNLILNGSAISTQTCTNIAATRSFSRSIAIDCGGVACNLTLINSVDYAAQQYTKLRGSGSSTNQSFVAHEARR